MLTFHIDHCELVAVDGEDERRVARDRDQAESVSGLTRRQARPENGSKKIPTVYPFERPRQQGGRPGGRRGSGLCH